MSRSAVALLGLTCLLAARAGAQRRELTFLAGGTLSGASGSRLSEVDHRAGLAGGLSLRLPRSPYFSLETELLAVQKRLAGQREPSTAPPIQVGPRSDEVNLWYIEADILLRVQRGYSSVRPIRPFLQLGPYGGFRLACRRTITRDDGTVQPADCNITSGTFNPGSESFIPAVYQEVDVGLLGGLGVEIRQLALGVRFSRSLRDLVETGATGTSPFDGSRLWSVMVSVEYLIRVI
jgi:hypothetical protein